MAGPLPIEQLKKILNTSRTEISRLQSEIIRINQNKSRLQRAEDYLKNFAKHHAAVEKIENNPFLKGKALVKKSAKQEYKNAISTRDRYKELMEKEDISNHDDFKKQMSSLGAMESNIPIMESQIETYQRGFNLLDGILKGIEQASREMTREQQRRQQQRERGKGRKKQRSQGIELEM